MSTTDLQPASLDFDTLTLDELQSLTPAECDPLPFGVVGLSSEGMVEVYNATESRLAGLPAEGILGTHYFSGTAQCMNNFMVAQHFDDEEQLDLTLDYVLTLRMRPTPVRLRLLQAPGVSLHYVLILRQV